jgi:hypothetical protein
MWRLLLWYICTDVSDEGVAFIFRVEANLQIEAEISS